MSDKKVEKKKYNADKMGYLMAATMLGGAGYGFYSKSPAGWIGQGIGLGLMSLIGAHQTSKNPENCYMQFGVSFFYLYGTCQDMYVQPKFARIMAPFAALSALNCARCTYKLYKRDQPVRQI